MFEELQDRRGLLRASAQGGLAVVAVSLLSSVLGRAAAAQLPPKITLGRVPINASALAYLGPTNPFKDEGVSFDLVPSQTGPAILQGMAAKDIIVGDLGIVPAMVAMTRGLPIITPYLGAVETPSRPYERIMVKQDSPIRTLADLKGKKLAILARGSVPDLVLSALSKKTSISRNDIQIVLIPPPNQPAALAQGLVDAIFAIPPSDTVAEKQYNARTIATTADLVPYLGFAIVCVRKDFASAYPVATQKMFAAWIKVARWIRDNDQLATLTAAKNLRLPEDLQSGTHSPLFLRNGLHVMANVWQVYEMLVQSKTIDPHPDPARMIEDGIVEPVKRLMLPAVEEVGFQKDAEMDAMIKGQYPLLSKPPESFYSDWEKQILRGGL